MNGRGKARARALAVLIVVYPGILRAQDGPAGASGAQDGPMHTLHVYTDLIQVPVLVLDQSLEVMKPIEPSRFLVSLDSGPAFRPKHVRQEGEDPITLGILLDVSGESTALMPRMANAVAALAPDALHAKDHVSVFALNCGLTRTLNDVPADPAVLKAGVDEALRGWVNRTKEKRRAPCEKRMQLWDGMGRVAQAVGNLPGRRVLLVVSDGVDHGSTVTGNALRVFTQMKGIAVFGLRSAAIPLITPMMGRVTGVNPLDPKEDVFSTVCQSSGGVVIAADRAFFERQMLRMVAMVRSRYILEFARARNDSPGEHSIVVSIAKSNAYIRPAGVLVMVPDPALAKDPSTIPRDATDAPEMGKRKPVKQGQ